jgi:hypothetical protein
MVRSDELLDIVESVELALDPSVHEVFDRALSEFESGETIGLAEIKR